MAIPTILLVLANAPSVMLPVPSLKCEACLSVKVPVPLKVLAVCPGALGNTWSTFGAVGQSKPFL